MKHLLYIFTLCFFSVNLDAQSCNSNESFAFPDISLTEQGFAPAGTYTCIAQGQSTEVLIPFIAYTTINNGGNVDTVTQLSIDSIANLPCGLCWAANNGQGTYTAGQMGCIALKGTTGSALGQYELQVQLTLHLLNGGTVQKTVAEIAGTGGKVIVRVIDGNSTLPAINYGITGNISSPCN